jgi:hypothetical protein
MLGMSFAQLPARESRGHAIAHNNNSSDSYYCSEYVAAYFQLLQNNSMN